ncbi:MAG: hypothetical protein HY436_00345 [Candidatus Liptonbacteria bacterium]|nr:hypothetical protein [Candidatus Liptonbacteria bacterium]
MQRTAKQLLYSGFFIFVFALLGFALFALVRSAPSCFDGKKNQEEVGVDCGAPCALSCAAREAKPIQLSGTPRLFRAGSGRSTLIIGVQNPNPELAAPEFSYRIDLYGEAGTLLRSLVGRSFLYAGEFKYLFFSDVSFAPGEVARVAFIPEVPEWSPADAFPRPRVTLQNREETSTEEGIRISGVIANGDSVAVARVQIVAVFFGKFGQMVGASATEMDGLAPGEARSFLISHPPLSDLDLAATSLFLFSRRP